MSPRAVKVGRAVKLGDPVRHAVRCWSQDHEAILGAGGRLFPRWVLDTPGIIAAVGDARRRVLIAWPDASQHGELVAGGDAGLWLDADQVEPA